MENGIIAVFDNGIFIFWIKLVVVYVLLEQGGQKGSIYGIKYIIPGPDILGKML